MKQVSSDAIREHLTLSGVPLGPLSQIYMVDPVNGSDSYDGQSTLAPMKTVEAAYAKCTDAQHDVVLLLSGATADNPAASITWSKSYTHLIGLSGDLPGVGQRSRIVGTAALDLTVVVTFSGSGCIVRNVQFYNGGDADADAGAVLVSGGRNYFKDCFFAGMAHATPAARANSYSLKVTGDENYFEDCTIGLDTIVRAAANSELIVSGVRNKFRHCNFLSYSVTAGKFLVTIDPSAQDLRYVIFDDCLFYNYTPNWATGITDAFHMVAGNTVFVIMRGNCQLVGTGMGWADTVTHMYASLPQPNAGFGISANPTT